MIPHERLRTPIADGAVLVEPAILASLRGISLPDWAEGLRQALRARLGVGGPLIVTGHQCEFFHAGVFAKTIAARRLAERERGDALFVHVDSDIPKSRTIAWPAVDNGRVGRVTLPLPAISLDSPIELHGPPVDAQWERLFHEMTIARTGVRDSLLSAYSNGWMRANGALTERFAAGHRATQIELGISPLRDVMMSDLAETPEFGAFAARLILDAAAAEEAYNAAQAAYRRRHRVRNPARPVPLLETVDGRTESPLWVYRRDGDGRRHRLAVQDRGATLALFAGEQLITTVDRTDVASVGREGGAIPTHGWMIRPRALTLSAFCRLLLADLFIHGIGGAKYDEVTDEFMHGWLGVDLPPLLCVSATLRIPFDVAADDGPAVTPRDLDFNPQRVLRSAPPALVRRRSEFVRESDALRRQRAGRRERRRVFDAIRAINAEIVSVCPVEVAEVEAAWRGREARRRETLVAADRDVFYAMHSRKALEQMAAAITERIRG